VVGFFADNTQAGAYPILIFMHIIASKLATVKLPDPERAKIRTGGLLVSSLARIYRLVGYSPE